MMTKSNTTYIFLSRGDEDVRLLNEIHKIFASTGINNAKKLIVKYPVMYELKQGLEAEREREDG